MLIEKLSQNRFFMIFTLPFFLGLTSVFCFQPFNITILSFFIISSLFLLLTYVQKRSRSKYRKKPYRGNFFFIGYLFGIGFFISTAYWISYSLTFDENLRFLIPFSIILIPLCLGLFFGLATFFSGPFLKNDYSSFFLFCLTFSFIEFLRGNILSGFPWNLWSYTWSWSSEIIQILNPIGLYAFNSISIAFFCAPALLFFKSKYKYFIFSIFLTIFFSFYIYGSYKINKEQDLVYTPENSINVKVVSPNFDMRYISSDAEIKQAIQKLVRYSDPNLKKKTVFIWPEGVFAGVYLEDLKKFSNFFNSNFSKNHLIIFGINTEDKLKKSYFNSFVIVNNNLDILYKYDKRKLVPFGEFLPLDYIFAKFGLKKITHGYGSFSEGSGKQENFKFNNLNLFPLICYEIIFPWLTQQSDKNTNMIVNISEDAWFGDSVGPYQHFAKAIFRSIENNTYLVRSANKGVSAFISNNGIVLKRLGPNEVGNIELDVPLINNNFKNKNDLIFFILLFTYTIIFLVFRNKF